MAWSKAPSETFRDPPHCAGRKKWSGCWVTAFCCDTPYLSVLLEVLMKQYNFLAFSFVSFAVLLLIFLSFSVWFPFIFFRFPACVFLAFPVNFCFNVHLSFHFLLFPLRSLVCFLQWTCPFMSFRVLFITSTSLPFLFIFMAFSFHVLAFPLTPFSFPFFPLINLFFPLFPFSST